MQVPSIWLEYSTPSTVRTETQRRLQPPKPRLSALAPLSSQLLQAPSSPAFRSIWAPGQVPGPLILSLPRRGIHCGWSWLWLWLACPPAVCRSQPPVAHALSPGPGTLLCSLLLNSPRSFPSNPRSTIQSTIHNPQPAPSTTCALKQRTALCCFALPAVDGGTGTWTGRSLLNTTYMAFCRPFFVLQLASHPSTTTPPR